MLGSDDTVGVGDMASDWSVGVEVGYVVEDGTRHRVTLADAWAVRFEEMAPAQDGTAWWALSVACHGRGRAFPPLLTIGWFGCHG